LQRIVVVGDDKYKYAFKTFQFSMWLLSFFGNGKMWRGSQTRCRLYLYSSAIVISFWDSSFF